MNTVWTQDNKGNWSCEFSQLSYDAALNNRGCVDPWGVAIDWSEWRKYCDEDGDWTMATKKYTINGYNVHTLTIFND